MNLIHVAKIERGWLFLRKLEPNLFQWFNGEKPTSCIADSAEEALRMARREWKGEAFQPVRCGYRFTLPERDEHGNVALFYQMVKSIESMTGSYFDEELGHNCIVNQIPLETRTLYESLKSAHRL